MPQTIIKNVFLFDGTATHPDSSVSFDSDSGKILSVSNSSSSSQHDANATIVDGKGHTLLPGLIEYHMHCHGLHVPKGTPLNSVLRSPLKCGVTTVCDMHSDPAAVKELQSEATEELKNTRKSGTGVTMSDLKSSHYGATIRGGWPKPVVLASHPGDPELEAMVETWPSVTVDTAPEFVKSHKANGADYIKLMQENCCSLAMPTDSIPVASLEFQTAIVKAARAADLKVVGHALSVDMTEIVLQAGADGLTHTFIDQAPPESIIEMYKKTGAFVIPTLVALSSLTNEDQHRREKFAKIAYDRGIIDDFTKSNMLDVMGMKSADARLEYAFQTVKRLKEEGIDVVAGTDAVAGLKGTAIGPSLWMELEMYVEKCGFSNLEALTAATSLGAKRFGFDDRGIVKEGKRADLLLVKGNPTETLSDLWEREVVGVWKEGVKAV